jgi:hypothetical protein
VPCGAAFVLEPSHLFERPPQGEFDLSIEAAQFIIGPTLHGLEYLRVKTEEVWFALRHSLLVDRPRVDHRLRCLLAAQHDQQVGDHGGLPLLVELDDIV